LPFGEKRATYRLQEKGNFKEKKKKCRGPPEKEKKRTEAVCNYKKGSGPTSSGGEKKKQDLRKGRKRRGLFIVHKWSEKLKNLREWPRRWGGGGGGGGLGGKRKNFGGGGGFNKTKKKEKKTTPEKRRIKREGEAPATLSDKKNPRARGKFNKKRRGHGGRERSLPPLPRRGEK